VPTGNGCARRQPGENLDPLARRRRVMLRVQNDVGGRVRAMAVRREQRGNVGKIPPHCGPPSLATDNPDYEGLSMQNKRPIGGSPSHRAVTAKIEKLLAANPKATDKARFKMLSKWLEHNPVHQRSVNHFLTATHLSHTTQVLGPCGPRNYQSRAPIVETLGKPGGLSQPIVLANNAWTTIEPV
jgi:hypothetical protein